MQAKKGHLWPVLILFFLAPAIGELLSGSSPPAEFFNPIVLLIQAALYGSGALLIRELRVRWNKGWPTVLALGVAYGIVEEGLLVKSFFDPNWVDLDLLGTYGRWNGVNWVWCEHLTIYHTIFSIAVPILLLDLLFPALQKERWLSRRGMIGFALLLLADVLFGFFFLTAYRPPWGPYLGAALLAGALVWLAWRLPAQWGMPQEKAVPRPLLFALAGFGLTLAVFFVAWGLPALSAPVGITLAALPAIVALAAWGIPAMSRGGAWGEPHQLALAAGGLGFFILLAPLQELDKARPDNPGGMALVALVALVLLVLLWRRVKRPLLRIAQSQIPSPPPIS